jgi:hypothetical protein
MKEVLKLVRDAGLLSKGDIADKIGTQESTLDSVFFSAFVKMLSKED